MYILINNRPFNVLDLKISDIQKLEPYIVSRIVNEWSKFKPGLKDYEISSNIKEEITAIYKFCKNAHWEISKLTDEEYDTLYQGQKWKETPGLVVFDHTKYGESEFLKVKFNPESYYFRLNDKDRYQFSKIYNSKEEAEDARNRLIMLINKVFASLKRVEI